jgi:hypothetical protein
VLSSIILLADDMRYGSPLLFFFGALAQIDVSTGGLGVEISCLVSCYSRSVFVAIKFGIKAYSVLGSAVFALALVAGCNSEEPAPAGAPAKGPGAAAPSKPVDSKPVTPAAPPVTAPTKKPDTK